MSTPIPKQRSPKKDLSRHWYIYIINIYIIYIYIYTCVYFFTWVHQYQNKDHPKRTKKKTQRTWPNLVYSVFWCFLPLIHTEVWFEPSISSTLSTSRALSLHRRCWTGVVETSGKVWWKKWDHVFFIRFIFIILKSLLSIRFNFIILKSLFFNGFILILLKSLDAWILELLTGRQCQDEAASGCDDKSS